MTEMAGEVADGVLLHTFTNRAYLEKIAFPALDTGASAAGREPARIQMSLPLFMAMGDTEEEIAGMRAEVRRQLAFYASTPSYRPVLEVIGFEDIQPELTALSKRGEWTEMVDLVSDELIEHFCITGTPEEMPALARRHLGGRVQRVTSYFGWPISDPDRLKAIFASFTQEESAA